MARKRGAAWLFVGIAACFGGNTLKGAEPVVPGDTRRPVSHTASSDNGDKLTLGVVQLALEGDLATNRDKIIRFVRQAKVKGCRVVVFPETALYSPPESAKAEIDAAVAAVQQAASANNIYVIFCVKYKRTGTDRPFERLLVVNPEGRVIHSYDKLWSDARFNGVPGPFAIDGIPCCAAICADRWIRGVEELPALKEAKILFECSNNYANEWIEDLGWYWYVPRARRNQAYVVFANTARENRGEGKEGHGHSAVIAPDGSLVTSAGEESDRLLVAALDLSKAARTQAVQRREHPLFKPFWQVGLDLMDGRPAPAAPFEGYVSPRARITIAAAQMACSRSVADNVARMKRMIRSAKAKGADVAVFPELTVTGAGDAEVAHADEATLKAALAQIQEAAKAAQIAVVFGMPHVEEGKRQNCAFAVSPEGTLMTRYAQIVVDRPDLFVPGSNTRSLWLRIKGVPAVPTIGRDALWSEIAELAAVRGAQLHFHLCYDRDTSKAGTLLRHQLWVNLASFRTFTATVNAAAPAGLVQPSGAANGGSILWEDFHRAHSGKAGGYAPHSAVRLAAAGAGEEILIATQEIPPTNPHFGLLTGKTNPQMKPWYEAGARVIDR
jgi:predicted amidohydrolase